MYYTFYKYYTIIVISIVSSNKYITSHTIFILDNVDIYECILYAFYYFIINV